MLQVQQVTRCFGRRTALSDVSFEARSGELVGVLGPNGAGKTTLLRLAACYLQPTRGAIRFDRLDSFRHPLSYRRALGYLPERCPLYDDMTVAEYLLFRARIKGLPFLKARRRVREMIEKTGMADVRGRLLAGLSFGARRRVGVADALLAEPKLLLLDDPISNVDVEEVARLTTLVTAARQHAVTLISGHALDTLAKICTRFIVLRGGCLTADLTAEAVQARCGTSVELEIGGVTDDEAVRRFAARFAAGNVDVANVMDLGNGWKKATWKTGGDAAVCDAVAAETVRQGWRLRAVHRVITPMEQVLADLVRGDGAACETGGTPS